MIAVSCGVFLILNLVVIVMIWVQLFREDAALAKHDIVAGDRVVTSSVLMALIGATVVETGFAIRTIMKNLFGGQE